MSSSVPPTSGEGTSNSSRTGAASPAVLIDVDAAPAPAALGQVNDGNIYNVWNYGFSVGQGFKCGFCGDSKKSGGATRLVQHLAGVIGDVTSCTKVPDDVKLAMRRKHKETKDRKKELQRSKQRLENTLLSENGGKESIYVASDEEEQARIVMADYDLQQELDTRQHGSGSSSAPASSSGSHRRPLTVQARIDSFVTAPRSVQPRIDTTLKGGVVDKLAQAWSKWFHANDIPGIKADCPYFRAAMRLTQESGTTNKLFSGSDIDGPCLDANYKSIEEAVEVFKRDWKKYGVTIMCDSWTGPTSMSIINFMVYCHGRTFFHKAINASEHIQNADYLYTHIKRVVDDIGPENVVQLVTDNGANYKKACGKLVETHPHIVWQPCAAHTINLMLKDIGKFSEIDDVVSSAKKCTNFLHSHNRLHNEMKRRIGGEIVRWNATRFGTVFMFLQSLWDRKDKFRQWMVSDEWRNSSWNNEPGFKYVDSCMTSSQWWDDIKVVLDTIGPLYSVLRYVDGDEGTVAGLMPRLLNAIKEMEVYLGEGTQRCNRYMRAIKDRVQYLYDDTFIVAAAVLDPIGHYRLRLHENNKYLRALEEAIERLAESVESGVEAIRQIRTFISYEGKFDGKLAKGAVGKMAASDWWVLFGGDTPELQKYAIRIVAQCVSSSGCERNWSTFALVHTKLRNRLGYEKLRRLVYVRHNLKQRLKQGSVGKNQTVEKEADPCALLMDCTLFDESNPIMDWLNKPRTADDDLSLEELLGPSKRRRILALRRANRSKGKRKIVEDDEEEDFIETDGNDTDENSPHGSPTYAESGDSSSTEDSANEPEAGDVGERQLEEQAENNNGRTKRARKKKREVGFLY